MILITPSGPRTSTSNISSSVCVCVSNLIMSRIMVSSLIFRWRCTLVLAQLLKTLHGQTPAYICDGFSPYEPHRCLSSSSRALLSSVSSFKSRFYNDFMTLLEVSFLLFLFITVLLYSCFIYKALYIFYSEMCFNIASRLSLLLFAFNFNCLNV